MFAQSDTLLSVMLLRIAGLTFAFAVQRQVTVFAFVSIVFKNFAFWASDGENGTVSCQRGLDQDTTSRNFLFLFSSLHSFYLKNGFWLRVAFDVTRQYSFVLTDRYIRLGINQDFILVQLACILFVFGFSLFTFPCGLSLLLHYLQCLHFGPYTLISCQIFVVQIYRYDRK